MRVFPVGHRLPTFRVLLVPVLAVLLSTPVSNAQAQFGKLKKIGADAIKDKAKEKVVGKETPETLTSVTATVGSKSVAAGAKPVSMTINASQLDLMLAALTPMAAEAEKATQIRKMKRDKARKDSIGQACLADGQTAMIANRRTPTLTAAMQARSRQMEKDLARLSEIGMQTFAGGEKRAGAFAMDSSETLQNQFLALNFGLKCFFDFTPIEVMETKVATYGMSGDLPVPESRYPADTRRTFTLYEFAILRERIALFALSSADPTLKVGKEGVFTAEERAALTARAAEIQKLTPYFKNGTISWKGTDDLAKW